MMIRGIVKPGDRVHLVDSLASSFSVPCELSVVAALVGDIALS